MKTKTLVSSAVLLAFTALPALGAVKYAPGSYEVDSAHSKVGFEVTHLVISSVEGRFTQFDGTVDLNEKFAQTKIKVVADANSVDTGVEKRDNHLRSADFFDAQKNPKITFESTEISGSPDSFKLTGNLTIKGVTKKVTFDAKYLGTVKDGNGREKAAFTAKAKINRRDFGLTWGKMVEAGPVVGDEVAIDLRIQAGKAEAKKL